MKFKAMRYVGDPAPVEGEASLIVVEADDGTPVMVGCEYGPDRTFLVAHCEDPEFSRVIESLGLSKTIILPSSLAGQLKNPDSLRRA